MYPKIRRNLRFDIASLTYKSVKIEGGIPKMIDYKMEHINDNPQKKYILCICIFKLDDKNINLKSLATIGTI